MIMWKTVSGEVNISKSLELFTLTAITIVSQLLPTNCTIMNKRIKE